MGIKLESLEKKNRMLLGEIEGIGAELAGREREVMELRRLGVGQDRYRDI